MAFSLFIVMIRFVIPSSTILGRLESTEIYVDMLHFKKAVEVTGIKIYQYSCVLFFLNRDHFRDNLYQKTLQVSSDDILELIFQLHSDQNRINQGNNRYRKKLNEGLINEVHTIIIDCSTISYIDSSGVDTIQEIIDSLKELNIKCFLCSIPTQVLTMFERKNLLENISKNFSGLFPSIHDAVVNATDSSGARSPLRVIYESQISHESI